MVDYDHAKKIFNKARKFPRGKVHNYLNRTCGDDSELRSEVERLLIFDLKQARTHQDSDLSPIAGEYRSGDTIDKFTIGEILGEGGMGIVYQAEQAKPIKRKVAIKVLKPGTDTKATLTRFDAERQALAIMDHPGIAKVIDAGATKEGRPWFAMEYIEGKDLTTFCDEENMSIKDRLVLFTCICDAIQHAHMKGIVHRDLKPGNILVKKNDQGAPEAKIIDFGIAKAMSATLTDVTHHTSIGALVGTIKYMSPEQIGGAIDIDTRSDLYSLGIILYELLGGCSPYEWKTLQSLNDGDIRRVIQEVIPPNPTTRLSGQDDAEIARICSNRDAEPAQLKKILRKELEWIPLHALRKGRDERYASAEAFASDIRNYLIGQPLIAGPVTRIYRTKKFLFRNKLGTGVAAAFLLLLIGATVVSLGLWQQALQANHLAQKKAVEAERETKNATTLTNFLFDQINKDPGNLQTIKEDILGRIDAQGESDELNPDIGSEILGRLAQQAHMSGRHDVGIDIHEEIKQIVLEHDINNDPIRSSKDDYYRALNHLDRAEYDKALQHLTNANATQSAELGNNHPDTLRTRSAIARLDHERGNYKKSESAFEAILKSQDEIVNSDNWSEEDTDLCQKDFFQTTCRLGLLYIDMGKLPEAEKQLEIVEDKPGVEAQYGLAVLRLTRGDFNPVQSHVDRARDSAVTDQEKLRARYAEASLMVAKHEYEDAENKLEEIYNLQKSNPNIGINHPDTKRTACMRIELILQQQDRSTLKEQVNEYLERALDIHMDVNRYMDWGPVDMHIRLLKFELRLLNADDPRNVAKGLRNFLEKTDNKGANDGLLRLRAKAMYGLASARAGDVSQAFYLKDALENQESTLGKHHWSSIRTRIDLCELLLRADQHEKAEDEIKEVQEILKQQSINEHVRRRSKQELSGVYLLMAKDLAKSESEEKQMQRLEYLGESNKLSYDKRVLDEIYALRSALESGKFSSNP